MSLVSPIQEGRKFSIAVESSPELPRSDSSNRPLNAYLMYLRTRPALDKSSTTQELRSYMGNSRQKHTRSNSCPVSVTPLNPTSFVTGYDVDNCLSNCLHNEDNFIHVDTNVARGPPSRKPSRKSLIRLSESSMEGDNLQIAVTRSKVCRCNDGMLCRRHHHRRSSVALKFQNPKMIDSWDEFDDTSQDSNDEEVLESTDEESPLMGFNGGLFKDNYCLG